MKNIDGFKAQKKDSISKVSFKILINLLRTQTNGFIYFKPWIRIC